jgi:hypothetical protein
MYPGVGGARALDKVCLPISLVFTIVVLFVTLLELFQLFSFTSMRHIFYRTYSCVLNAGRILGPNPEAVWLGINGTSNRSHGSEQKKGNLGDLHGEGLRALAETIGKMDRIITDGIGLDELEML